MGKARKLIDKTSKLNIDINNRVKDRDKINKIDDVLANNLGIFKLVRGTQRRYDETFGVDYIAQEPELSFEVVAISLKRIDFDDLNKDYGISITLPPGIISAVGILAGDEVVFLEGSLEGRSFEVISVESTNVLRLDDVTTFSSSESNIVIKFNISTSGA